MATGYEINFTHDPLGNRSFQLSPYTTNGTLAPNNDTLSGKSSSAATTLLLYGRGSPNYGERIAENMVQMLEHFSSPDEPVRPISGQIWYDRSGADDQLRVYNAERYQIIQDPLNPTTQYFGLTPPNVVEQAAMLARFVSGYRLRITNITTQLQEEYLVVGSTLSGGLVTVEVAPSPSTARWGGTWYVGGWEYVLQNNTPLREDLDAGTIWTIKNLPDPVNSQDAATRFFVEQYVDNELGNQNQLSELTDVVVTAPAPDQILIYDAALVTPSGTGGWKNDSGTGLFLSLSGGTMANSSSNINMNGAQITNLDTSNFTLYPANDGDAVPFKYLDDALTAITGGAVGNLDDLLDVDVAGAVANSYLSYNGTQWVDTTNVSAPWLLKTGGTMTGNLTLSGPGHTNAPGLAATESFVTTITGTILASANAYTDSQILTLPNEDYVTTGFYNAGLQELTLQRLLGGSVVVDMSGGSAITSEITHTMGDPNSASLSEFNGGLAFEELFFDTPAYPDITLDKILNKINIALGSRVTPTNRITFTANGSSTIYLGDTSGGAQPNQMNPAGDLLYENVFYEVGFNNLEIYVNGVKQYADVAGYQRVIGDGSPPFRLTKGIRTGLVSGSPLTGGPYDFRITVNGGTQVTINVPGVESLGELIEEINDVADTNYWQSGSPNANYAFSCELIDGNMMFYSGIPGTGSSIALAAGTGTDLFANLVGDAATTGLFTVSFDTGFDPAYAPTTLGYSEVGRFGEPSETVVFNTPPASGAIVEVLVQHKMIVR